MWLSYEQSSVTSVTVKTVLECPPTSKLCVEVWRIGYEFSLNPGNKNWKLEIATPKFPAKICLNFHWKSSGVQTETSDFEPDFLFLFLNGVQPVGWILYTRKAFATRDTRGDS